ncbi:hypothetical protein [Streptomyces sp. ODS28]|uniref:hypothetical protein n=1 Tax=Streptomyces sp. ODS28 TaxID=3136688 RepID=UPI0031EE1E88
MKPNSWRSRALPLGAAGVCFLALGAASSDGAEAAAPVSAIATTPTVTTYPGTDVDGDDSVNNPCPIKLYGYTGRRICEFQYFRYDWGDGNLEYFVVGTNYSVWHIWKGADGWKNLGGTARTEEPNGTYDTDPPGVATVSPGHNCWWRPWDGGSWPGTWRLC